MKKLFILTAIIATSLIATKGYSQVYVGARFGHVGRLVTSELDSRSIAPARSSMHRRPLRSTITISPDTRTTTIRHGTVTTGIVSTSNTTVLSLCGPTRTTAAGFVEEGNNLTATVKGLTALFYLSSSVSLTARTNAARLGTGSTI